jgi:hypothetical protein
MGRTACTEPQCLYSRAIPLLPLRAVRPVQSLSACTRVHFTFTFSNIRILMACAYALAQGGQFIVITLLHASRDSTQQHINSKSFNHDTWTTSSIIPSWVNRSFFRHIGHNTEATPLRQSTLRPAYNGILCERKPVLIGNFTRCLNLKGNPQ